MKYSETGVWEQRYFLARDEANRIKGARSRRGRGHPEREGMRESRCEKREVYDIRRDPVIFVSIPISFSRGFNLADEIGGGGPPLSSLKSILFPRHSLSLAPSLSELCSLPISPGPSPNQSVQVSYPSFFSPPTPPFSWPKLFLLPPLSPSR